MYQEVIQTEAKDNINNYETCVEISSAEAQTNDDEKYHYNWEYPEHPSVVSEDAADEVVESKYNAKVTKVESILEADDMVEVNYSAKVTEVEADEVVEGNYSAEVTKVEADKVAEGNYSAKATKI